MEVRETIEQYQEKVHVKLILRQLIFSVIITVLIIMGVLNVMSGTVDITLALSGFLVATIIGVVFSRVLKISWHEEKGKVVGKLDTFGIALLIVYFGIEFQRDRFFSYWLSGASLTAFGLIILTGLLLGRFLGTFFKIKKVLAEDAPAL